MEIIKLGDKLTIPGKNVKGEVAFIGETHFSGGTWFGIILDDPIGKHNGTVENKRYFKCPKNHGMFIKASYFEKECVDFNVHKRCSLIPKRIKYSNYQKTGSKLKEEITLSAPERKMKVRTQKKNVQILGGDNATNTNDENTESRKITECGDNNNDSNEKKFQYVRRYPNYLKASSKLAGSHFCLNRNKENKTDHGTNVGDHVPGNNDRNIVSSIADNNENPDKDDDETPKRIIYPNYLKASSKLIGKHFCITKGRDVTDEEMKDTPDKTVEIQTSKGHTVYKDNSENPYTNLIKYPYHQKTSNFKENYSCLTKSIEMSKEKSFSKKKDDTHSLNIQDITMELEAMKLEIEDLKSKLKSAEASLQESLSKYKEALEEIKHLKYDNECQRKQIKFQKSHLKLLKISQGNHLKKTDNIGMYNKKSKRKKIELLENTLNEYGNCNTDIFDRKIDLESVKNETSPQRMLELEEQNRLMIQGLVEIRHFLKTQCEAQSVELEPLNLHGSGRFLSRNNKRCNFSESSDAHTFLNSEAGTDAESVAQLREYSEMLREMTKFNELMKEKKRYTKDWEAINLAESLGETSFLQKQDSYYINQTCAQSTQSSPCGSTSNVNTENYIDNSKAKMDSEIFQNPSTLEDGVLFEPVDCADKSSHKTITTDLIYNENVFVSNTILIEPDDLEKDVPEYVKCSSSKKSERPQSFSLDLPRDSAGIDINSNDNSPKVLRK